MLSVAGVIATPNDPNPSETPPSPKKHETGVGPTSRVRSPTPCAAHGVTYCLQQTWEASVRGDSPTALPAEPMDASGPLSRRRVARVLPRGLLYLYCCSSVGTAASPPPAGGGRECTMVKRWCSRSAHPAAAAAAAAAATAADEVEGPEAAAAPAKAKAGRRNGAPAAVAVVGGAVLFAAGGGVAVVACAVTCLLQRPPAKRANTLRSQTSLLDR